MATFMVGGFEWVATVDAVVDGDRDAVLHRLGLLADVGAALSGTLDVARQLREAGQVLVRHVGDWCVLDLVREDQSVQRVVVRGDDIGPVEAERVSAATVTSDEGLVALAPAVAGPRLLSDSAEAGRLLGELGLAADVRADHVVVAPLITREAPIGALALGGSNADRRLSALDVPLIAEAAARIALAVENARLHSITKNIAERFQRALLSDLPELDDLHFCARYSASAMAARVGGDWYDAFDLPGGDTALIIGDVSGHDLAAALTMSELRSMVRGIACDRQEPPGLILQRLDRACHQLCPGALATCIYALVKTEDGEPRRLQHASAGHPPPLLVTAGGDAEFLEGGRELLLGVQPETRRHSAVDPLPPGCTVLLYTDGLVARHGEVLNVGLARLRRLAASAAGAPVDAFCDIVLSGMELTGVDDTAVLAVRVGSVKAGSGRSGRRCPGGRRGRAPQIRRLILLR